MFDGILGVLTATVVGTILALLLHFRKDIFELLAQRGRHVLQTLGDRDRRWLMGAVGLDPVPPTQRDRQLERKRVRRRAA